MVNPLDKNLHIKGFRNCQNHSSAMHKIFTEIIAQAEKREDEGEEIDRGGSFLLFFLFFI